MAKVGRPKKIDKIDLIEVGKLAALGLTDVEIAEWLGINRSTLSRYKKEESQFKDTIKKGKAQADMNVVKSLYKRATEDRDTTAMIFWLKNRRVKDWRDKRDIEHSGNIEHTELTTEERAERIKQLKHKLDN